MFQTTTAFELMIVNISLCCPNTIPCEKYVPLILILINEFESHYQDFRKKSELFIVFATPFSVIITAVKTKFQIECMRLKFTIKKYF